MRHRNRTMLALGAAAGLALLLGGCHDGVYYGSYGYGFDRHCDSSHLDYGYGHRGGHRSYGYGYGYGSGHGRGWGHGGHGGRGHCD